MGLVDIEPMSLHESLKKRGYTFRQHLEEESWGWRKPTVVDLDAAQRETLETGGVEALKENLNEKLYRPEGGLWTFPSFDIEEPPPCRPDLVLSRNGLTAALIVAPRQHPGLWTMAEECASLVAESYGTRLPLVDDAEANVDLLDTQHLIVFGGAHNSRLALQLALRYRTFFVDDFVPGDDGWVVTTHSGVHASGHNIAQVAAPPAHRAAALECIRNGLADEKDQLILRHTHRIKQGAAMAARFPSWESFTAGLPRRLPQLQGQDIRAPQDPASLADLLARGLDSGGLEKNFYNVAPVDIAIECAGYYQLSADPRSLQLFRELLFRMADYYLKTPGGASYPSDLDFRLGLLILHYARLEHEPVFDKDDRLILTNLLLACARATHEHSAKFWPPECRGANVRHNHQTFGALSLLYAADYFSRFNLPCVAAWRAYADAIFSGAFWNRSKQSENSGAYEPLAFEHGAEYSAFLGRGLSLFGKGCFKRMVQRQIAATDNFFRPVDYGDSAISMHPADSPTARLLATEEDGTVRWFAQEGFARQPVYAPGSLHDFPGLRMRQSDPAPATGDWEHIPLEPVFVEEVMPGFPTEFAFDKLSFRTGWSDPDQYLLLEGVGGAPSHSHHEANGLVRYNHLGRHWIVSNGYGRRVGIANVVKSFETRVLGPEDHNMLVLRRAGETVRDLPMCAALQRGRQGPLLFTTGALLGYGGVNWFRTLIVLAGSYLLVIDRIEVVQAGLERAWLEWNCLGQVRAQRNGFRLEQKGVFLDVTSASGWRSEQSVADQSACWKKTLEDGSYPYATFPLAKLVFQMPDVGAGQTHCLGTLLAVTRSDAPHVISQPAPGRILIEGPAPKSLRVEDHDLAVFMDGNRCEVRFSPLPEVPPPLDTWGRRRIERGGGKL